MNVSFFEKLTFLYRAWRFRLYADTYGTSFLLSRELEGKTAVDIGANRGVYSY